MRVRSHPPRANAHTACSSRSEATRQIDLTMVRRGRRAHPERRVAGSPKDGARAALHRAVMDVEQLEPPSRRDREVLREAWRGLVSGQWRLVDHFDANGRKYVVAAISEDAPSPRPASMSEREYQVMRAAALGCTNKEIAADLGIAPSTVRVLVHRAAVKLGTTDREGAIARFRALDGAHQVASAASRRR